MRPASAPAVVTLAVVMFGAGLAGCRADPGPPAGRAADPGRSPAPAAGTTEVGSRSGPGTDEIPGRPGGTSPLVSPSDVTGVSGGEIPGRPGGSPPGLLSLDSLPRTANAVPGRTGGSPGASPSIVYHVVKGARFFDILVARIGQREYVVLGETDDMCLDLPDQRDFDGDGQRDALVFRSPACRGDAAPGLLFFVSGDAAFRRSDPFPGHRPRIERWNGRWSVLAGGARHVLRDGRAMRVDVEVAQGPDGCGR